MNGQPRIKIKPKRCGSDGEGARLLMQGAGITLDDWQQLCVDCILGTDASGKYTATTAGISCARQNGKNVILEAVILYNLLVNAAKIVFTAHQMKTARKCFERLCNMFDKHTNPEYAAAVQKILYGTGTESIRLKNGGSIEFLARSRQSARGYDGISLLILDEAQELQEEMAASLIAILSSSATGNRQIIYTGTPPYVGCNGEVFRRYRQSCIESAGKGEELTSAWFEWGITGDNLADMDLSDREVWKDCNPALLTGRLTYEYTQKEYETLSRADFARERLGYWAKPASTAGELAIDPVLWDSCRSDEPRPEGKTAYGVKFTADGSEVVLAGAVISGNRSQRPALIGTDRTGRQNNPQERTQDAQTARIALIAIEPTGNGLQWLADWLNERYKQAACVVIDGRNGADVLIEKLKPTGGGAWILKDSIIKPSAQNVITAANMLINELNERTVTWYSEQEELRDSAITATKRPISGGWGFGGTTSAPIEACSLALWGCRTSKRNPHKKMLIG